MTEPKEGSHTADMKCYGSYNNLIFHFEDTVKVKGNDIAVVHNDAEINFAELRERALILSDVITSELSVKIGNRFDEPVAVLIPKSVDAVVSDLAIMYSGSVFMNLDIKTPADRLKNILNLIQPKLIITNHKYEKLIDGYEEEIIFIDDFNAEQHQPLTESDTDSILQRIELSIDTDPLCIINTSGSTGTPKGVILNQRSFMDFTERSREIFGFDGSEIIGSLSPIVFDIFDFELCMMMVYGSRIVLIDAMLSAFPARLLQYIAEHKVNYLFWVPSIMVNIANMELLDKISLPDLKTIWFAGEVFPTKQFLYWYDKLHNVTFANLYGPIEITLDCTYYIVKERPEETEPLPIGKAYYNTDVLILDDDRLCKDGEPGELCVRGTSLAMGYYNNPEKTAAAFVQNPLNKAYPETIYRTGDIVYRRSDGNIIFKGRKDSLIKHMGYRIELGEIEHVIENELSLVKYCCATYDHERKEIVLFYEYETEIDEKEFRKNLSKVFPAYMIPKVYIRMDILPRNANGKIDRLMLSNKAAERN